jgi:hypothetical protein
MNAYYAMMDISFQIMIQIKQNVQNVKKKVAKNAKVN